MRLLFLLLVTVALVAAQGWNNNNNNQQQFNEFDRRSGNGGGRDFNNLNGPNPGLSGRPNGNQFGNPNEFDRRSNNNGGGRGDFDSRSSNNFPGTNQDFGGRQGQFNPGPSQSRFDDSRGRSGPSSQSFPSSNFNPGNGGNERTSGRNDPSSFNRAGGNWPGQNQNQAGAGNWGPAPLNLDTARGQQGESANGASSSRQFSSRGRHRGWKRSRPVDKAHAFANLRRFGKGTGEMRAEDWKEHADQFCSLFPHNSKCRDGRRPDQTELSSMSKAIERRHQRRKIPTIKDVDWLNGVPSQLREKAKERREKFGKTSTETRNHFKNACRSGRINCRVQPQESREKRKLIRDHMAKVEKEALGLDDETADDNVEVRFDRTLRIKRALLEKANLTAEVDPIDDGIFEQDILLTENQSNMILNHLDKAGTSGDENLSPDEIDESPKPPTDALPPSDPLSGVPPALAADLPPPPPAAAAETGSLPVDTPPPPPPPTETVTEAATPGPSSDVDGVTPEGGARKKRSGVFLEQHFAEKWDISTPIPYAYDSSIAPWDKTDITDALDEISRVSCVRFRPLTSAPNGIAYINFVKINSPTFCGLSYVGRVSPVNTVYLSFQCGKNKGVVMHEVMHALGVIHQHLRVDRDQFIKVDWANVNPQKYDQFATADQSLYTSYGIKYSYDSIMHYNAYTNAIDVKKPTMIPLVNSPANLALLGQRDKMSVTDVNLINKMYCKAASCVDTNIYCGHWALTGTCSLQGNSVWMGQNCRKSCNLC